MLDGEHLTLSIPIDKKNRALKMLQYFADKHKVRVKHPQQLTGYLNFLSRAVLPGRAFTRRMYAKYSNITQDKSGKHKQYHHVCLDSKFKFDCQVWRSFLSHHDHAVLCRPMLDVRKLHSSVTLQFFTDLSGNPELGFGGVYNRHWFFGHWEPGFIIRERPSIAYLELFALVTGVVIWSRELKNIRMTVHCDNQSVVQMINTTSSSCPRCMFFIRLLVLKGLIDNRRVYAVYVNTKENSLADSLSRLDLDRFYKLSEGVMEHEPEKLPGELWPLS